MNDKILVFGALGRVGSASFYQQADLLPAQGHYPGSAGRLPGRGGDDPGQRPDVN